MERDKEETLTEAHELANNFDHLKVSYNVDRVKMLNEIITNLQGKLSRIADLIQIALDD